MNRKNEENDLFYKIALITSPSNNPFNIGPKIFPVHIIVNLQKSLTFIVMYLLIKLDSINKSEIYKIYKIFNLNKANDLFQ